MNNIFAFYHHPHHIRIRNRIHTHIRMPSIPLPRFTIRVIFLTNEPTDQPTEKKTRKKNNEKKNSNYNHLQADQKLEGLCANISVHTNAARRLLTTFVSIVYVYIGTMLGKRFFIFPKAATPASHSRIAPQTRCHSDRVSHAHFLNRSLSFFFFSSHQWKCSNQFI